MLRERGGPSQLTFQLNCPSASSKSRRRHPVCALTRACGWSRSFSVMHTVRVPDRGTGRFLGIVKPNGSFGMATFVVISHCPGATSPTARVDMGAKDMHTSRLWTRKRIKDSLIGVLIRVRTRREAARARMGRERVSPMQNGARPVRLQTMGRRAKTCHRPQDFRPYLRRDAGAARRYRVRRVRNAVST